MAYLEADGLPQTRTAPGLQALQRALLWIVGFGGAIVIIEPSPYEFATLTAIIVFLATGLKMRPLFVPLMLLLILINVGYSITSVALLDQLTIANWVATSWYMATTALFFAMVMSEDTTDRLDQLSRGLVFGAVITSLAGILGYFHLVPGGDDLLTLYGRARGLFKDPNVLGAFLILPALLALQCILLDRFAKAARATVVFGIIALAILLSFSRAAWGQLLVTSAFVVALSLLTSRTQSGRAKIVLIAVIAALAAALLLSVLLSFDSVGSLFRERASFDQSYDEGRFGRFGRHILGFELALDTPFGIGPLQFGRIFPEDTHNSFLNAFMSGGWLSGVCYPALSFTTVVMGFRYLFVRTPWQRAYIAFFAAFLGSFVESFIIDTDHWRHYFLILGTMWGMFAATQLYARSATGEHDPITR
jgi:O-antigen ligase/polysaccharide polymerase Wzy-like membrane protein